MGSQIENDVAHETMKVAYDAGVNFFDNAEVYAAGKSETVMGEAIKKYGWKRSNLVISTKIYWGGDGPNDKGLSRKHIVEGLKASLKRLDLEYVDLVFAHRPDALTPMEEIVRAFNWVIDQGWAFYWGTSEWSAEQLADAHRWAEKLGLMGPIMEQPQYNMFHRERFEVEYAPIYEKFGLGTTIWSPLASGILTGLADVLIRIGKYLDGIPKDSRLETMENEFIRNRLREGLLSPEGVAKQEKVRKLGAVAKELECSLAQLALAWCIKNPRVSTVITGASRVSQVAENMAALSVVPKLTPALMEKIDSILDNKPVHPPARIILTVGDRIQATIKKSVETLQLLDFADSANQGSNAVQVHVKIRPINQKETLQKGFKTCFASSQATTLYFPSFQVLSDPGLDVHTYPFDCNHDQDTTCDEFYASISHQILPTIRQGGTWCVFAYGQTGSGKTFTISSVCDRLVQDLPFSTHDISIQLLEVMGDIVRDLGSQEIVRVLVDSKGNSVIQGPTKKFDTQCAEDARASIEYGFGARKTKGTLKNDTSSRSHFICLMELTEKASGKKSQIKLVDLAGSERNSDTKHHDHVRIKESAYINSSLMALKNCIRERSAEDSDRVPYRASKLTILLKDVLAPASKGKPSCLVMVATLAPTCLDIAHSLDTFRYAAALKAAPALKPDSVARPSSSPMAWPLPRLDAWLSAQSGGVVTLAKLVSNDLVSKKADDFVLPAWKHLYDNVDESLWIKRCAPLDRKSAIQLRLAYRSLFLKKRPSTKATAIATSYHIETLLLEERPKPTVSTAKNRQQEAMNKIKQKGMALRKSVNTLH
ncbi:hypothetical protein HDV03_003192 [Kappamyces sp. JEL0829]|nr:hypothetical protein HDV03_003192 [Kappamyces sp. JEL0829]